MSITTSRAIIEKTAVHCPTEAGEKRVIELRLKHGAGAYIPDSNPAYNDTSYGCEFCVEIDDNNISHARESYFISIGYKIITVAEYEAILGETAKKKKASRVHCGFKIDGSHYDENGIGTIPLEKYQGFLDDLLAQRKDINEYIKVHRNHLKVHAKLTAETKGWK